MRSHMKKHGFIATISIICAAIAALAGCATPDTSMKPEVKDMARAMRGDTSACTNAPTLPSGNAAAASAIKPL